MKFQNVLLSQLADCSLPSIAITIEADTAYRIYNDSHSNNQSIELRVKEYAQCEWVHIYHEPHENIQISYAIDLEKESVLTHSLIVAGAKKATISVDMKMSGKKSVASLYGFYGLKADESIEIKTNQHHAVASTTSNLLYKGILADASQVVFNGMITIDQQAGESCAAQYNKNLLLSDKAKAVSIPSLQVLTNEVSCKHGSAIGRWDENQLWYLLSRGLSKEQAQQLLVEAFLADIFYGMTDHAMKEEIINLLVGRLLKNKT